MESNKVEEKMNALIKRNGELQGLFKANQDKVKEILDQNQKITNEFIYNSGAINNFKELLNEKITEEDAKETSERFNEKKLEVVKTKK